MEREPRPVEQLAADLGRLGVVANDMLMVHASLRAIGAVVGGADGVIDALELAVGPSGTLVMNVGVRDDWSWINEHPERERATLLRDADPFDCRTAPADPDNGVLAEVFRTRARTQVSDHPEGRIAASGRLAGELLVRVPWDDYYGLDSPLERLVHASGRVLRLGADIDTVTLLHYAEYLASVPSKRRVRRHRLVTTPDGPQIRVISCLDDSNGIVDHPGEDYFAVIMREYLAAGRASTDIVGRASSELIDASDLVDFAVAWMTEHLGGPR